MVLMKKYELEWMKKMSDYLEDEGQAFSQIKRNIDEFMNVELTLDNYKKFSNELLSKDNIIISQIENFKRDYQSEISDLNNKRESEEFKNSLEEGYVSRDVYEILLRINKIMRDTFSWKTIQQEMYRIMFEKLLSLISDVNAFSIKRDALKEMREMEEKRNEVIIKTVNNSNEATMTATKQLIDLTKEIVNEKLKLSDDKINNFYNNMLEQMRIERNEMIQSINNIIDFLSKKTNVEINSLKKDRIEQEKNLFSSEKELVIDDSKKLIDEKNLGDKEFENDDEITKNDDDDAKISDIDQVFEKELFGD